MIEEELRLGAHVIALAAREIGNQPLAGADQVGVAQLQPLAGKVGAHGDAAPVGDQAFDRGRQVFAQLALRGLLQKGGVWRSGPQEIGKALGK